ncbi:hypothetical protein P280DRAFT_548202 [Massarina eburnea CBS 473.64]|uniref:Uncharacterized protein n=1 Tax=Massarina eburnea CBS 473.64 TaxID=1395130 RepID=A0A6A6S4Y6_9PLEO|nr:hypothetical protein P280DRAFT_548202 [Massarina eburnea CBS 473.64]
MSEQQILPISPSQDGASMNPDDIRAAMSVTNLLTPPAQADSPPAIAADEISQAVAGDSSSSPTAKNSFPIGYPTPEQDVDMNGNASPVREFECLNDPQNPCGTDQYTMELSRKGISHHFGRNKASTRLIDFWPLRCRKHYQRSTYTLDAWELRKVALINEQFDEMERHFPGIQYTVTFKKAEENRLNTFSRKLAQGYSVAAAEAEVAHNPKARSFEAPIKILRELEAGLGPNKSIEDVKETLEVIKDMVKHKESQKVPIIEFVPQLNKQRHPIEVVKKAPRSASKTSAPKKKAPKKKAVSRVSEKGSIRKTSSKAPAKSKLKAEVEAEAKA